jgi:fatty acid desaturase
MNAKQLGLSIPFVGFLGLSVYTVSQYGYWGFFAAAVFANLATLTAAVDLVIALSLVTVWMWFDARERGISPLLYLVLTLTLGSVGPLLYLIRRARGEHPRPISLVTQEGRL